MGPRGHFYSGKSLAIRDKQVFRVLTGSQRTPRIWGVTKSSIYGEEALYNVNATNHHAITNNVGSSTTFV